MQARRGASCGQRGIHLKGGGSGRWRDRTDPAPLARQAGPKARRVRRRSHAGAAARGEQAVAARTATRRAGARNPKKSHGVFREGVAVKYAWIREHRDSFPIVVACDVLEVSASGYYA